MDNPYKKSMAKIVCECKGVTDQAIEELVKTDQVKTLDDLKRLTGAGTGCGKCQVKLIGLIEEYLHIYGKQ